MNTQLLSVFRHAFDRPVPGPSSLLDVMPYWTFAGLETRTDPAKYVWHGLKRGVDPRRPVSLFQCTLDGEGCFQRGRHKSALRAGDAFLVSVPSQHIYQLPRHSPSWTFYWLSTGHTDIQKRLARLHTQYGNVLHFPAESPLHTLCARLCSQIQRSAFSDRYAVELALWEWCLELERALAGQRTPTEEREQWLQRCRRQWLNHTGRTLSVTALARESGMSRSNFSHHFRKITGLSPARYLMQLRLQDVMQRLRGSSDKLETVALEFGFVDASHLTRTLWNHYQIKPGMLRRLLQNRPT